MFLAEQKMFFIIFQYLYCEETGEIDGHYQFVGTR
jgi:hypothetical protein